MVSYQTGNRGGGVSARRARSSLKPVSGSHLEPQTNGNGRNGKAATPAPAKDPIAKTVHSVIQRATRQGTCQEKLPGDVKLEVQVQASRAKFVLEKGKNRTRGGPYNLRSADGWEPLISRICSAFGVLPKTQVQVA